MKNSLRIFLVMIFLFINSKSLDAQWVQTNGPYGGGTVNCLATLGKNIFVGTADEGVFLSTNNGTNWTSVNNGLTDPSVYSLAVSDTNLYAVTYEGVFLSTNNGTSWTAASTGLTHSYVLALAVSGTNLFAGTSGGVFLSTNNGTSWSAIGLTTYTVYSLVVSGTNIFAGTYRDGVWRRPLSEMINSVERLSSNLPTHFSLDQNYPNPFKPTTRIKFQIPNSNHVRLRVFDLFGKEIATLVNEALEPGSYETTFDGADLVSGVYYYRLEAGGFVQTGKLVLLR